MSLLNEIKATGKALMRDEETVARLVGNMVRDGANNLQVIVDFDYTLTRVHRNGKRLPDSWGVLETSSFVTRSFLEKSNALKDKYLPIEVDAHMSTEEKVPHIVEFYQLSNRLLSECGSVKKEHFRLMVEQSDVELRSGTTEMMHHLHKAKIPVVVLSAGLGDMVKEILEVKGARLDNMWFVSNFIEFNADGNVTGLKGDVIHVYNKNEHSLAKALAEDESVKLEDFRSRHNVLIMGDSLGDACMADGVDNPQAVLKIGFLNHDVESDSGRVRLEKYLDAFDIVLVDDQTMNVALAILRGIFSPSS